MTSPSFSIKYIGPTKKKLFSKEKYYTLLRGLYTETGVKIREKMEQPFSTAEKGLPAITIKTEEGGVTVTTQDERWVYSALGTKIRWALMSPDFSPKTTPNILNAHGGSGRTLLRGKRAMMRRGIPPRPGIEARNWHVIISREIDSPFQKGYRTLLKKTFWV